MLEPRVADHQMRRMSDDELIRRARGGCKSATEFLLRKYQGLVESKARNYFLLGAEPEDVLQEGRIGLYKAIRDFSTQRVGCFRNFAALCVTRQIISAVKGASRHKHAALNRYVPMETWLGEDEEQAGVGEVLPAERASNPETIVLGRETRAAVSWDMNRMLSRLEHQVLRQYLQGSSYRDIALKLGTKVKQVDNALQRAKKKLERQVCEGALRD